MSNFGATPNIFVEFNTFEAMFWILLSLTTLTAARVVKRKYRSWLYFNTVNIFLFGITDVVELYTGGFLHTAQWLFWWKSVHVLGLVVGVVWYVRLRLKTRK